MKRFFRGWGGGAGRPVGALPVSVSRPAAAMFAVGRAPGRPWGRPRAAKEASPPAGESGPGLSVLSAPRRPPGPPSRPPPPPAAGLSDSPFLGRAGSSEADAPARAGRSESGRDEPGPASRRRGALAGRRSGSVPGTLAPVVGRHLAAAFISLLPSSRGG